MEMIKIENPLELAKSLSESDLVPDSYKNKPGNCLIAIDLANRLGESPLMIMNNINIIKGRASFSSVFLIAMINKSGKFKHDLRFKFEGNLSDGSRSCYAYTIDKISDEELRGMTFSLEIAKKEGLINKPMSKWQSIPDQMLMYRAASFFASIYLPEIKSGIGLTKEELEDINPHSEKVINPSADDCLNELNDCKTDIEIDIVYKKYKGRYYGDTAKELKMKFDLKRKELKDA